MADSVSIIVIDDDDDMRDTLRTMLEKEGYRVRCAANGGEVFKLLEESQTDLVITDIVMPVKEGFETIAELKRTWPEVKIIAISGGGLDGSRNYLDWAKDLGAHGVLAKPFARTEILSAISKVMGE